MESATIKEQKELIQYIRNHVKPYDFDLFEFDVDQRIDPMNWVNFSGFVDEVRDATRKKHRWNKKYIDDIEGIADRYFTHYYPLEYESRR